jgi:hypothetical protein
MKKSEFLDKCGTSRVIHAPRPLKAQFSKWDMWAQKKEETTNNTLTQTDILHVALYKLKVFC